MLQHVCFGLVQVIHTLQQRRHSEFHLRHLGFDGRCAIAAIAAIPATDLDGRARPLGYASISGFGRPPQFQLADLPGELAYLTASSPFSFSIVLSIRSAVHPSKFRWRILVMRSRSDHAEFGQWTGYCEDTPAERRWFLNLTLADVMGDSWADQRSGLRETQVLPRLHSRPHRPNPAQSVSDMECSSVEPDDLSYPSFSAKDDPLSVLAYAGRLIDQGGGRHG